MSPPQQRARENLKCRRPADRPLVLTDELNTDNNRIHQHPEHIHSLLIPPLRMAATLEITARPTVLLLGEGTTIRAPALIPCLSTSYYNYEEDEDGACSPGFRPPARSTKDKTPEEVWEDVPLPEASRAMEVALAAEKAFYSTPEMQATLLARSKELTQLYILLKSQQRFLYTRLDLLTHELTTSWDEETLKERAMILSGGKPELERRTLEAYQQGRKRKLEEYRFLRKDLDRVLGEFEKYERERDFVEKHLCF